MNIAVVKLPRPVTLFPGKQYAIVVYKHRPMKSKKWYRRRNKQYITLKEVKK